MSSLVAALAGLHVLVVEGDIDARDILERPDRDSPPRWLVAPAPPLGLESRSPLKTDGFAAHLRKPMDHATLVDAVFEHASG